MLFPSIFQTQRIQIQSLLENARIHVVFEAPHMVVIALRSTLRILVQAVAWFSIDCVTKIHLRTFHRLSFFNLLFLEMFVKLLITINTLP
mmetsp:Transcript_20038/g.20347  ORF Transcript_20038/g.20347 Transcript_20038/m.20347 type:complete len:90 (-) Transcript_20038:900-1169(-)